MIAVKVVLVTILVPVIVIEIVQVIVGSASIWSNQSKP